YSFSLGKITDVNWQYFQNQEMPSRGEKPAVIKAEFKINHKERLKKIQKKLESLSKTDAFKNEVFPMDTILLKREQSEEKKIILQKEIEKKNSELLLYLCRGIKKEGGN
ncbi:MAG: hypothetical protein IJ727_12150, partial [Treponema sp.]|nr:hypothetical protein [Treponema sp.]